MVLRAMAHDNRPARFLPQSFPRSLGLRLIDASRPITKAGEQQIVCSENTFCQGETARVQRERVFARDRWLIFRVSAICRRPMAGLAATGAPFAKAEYHRVMKSIWRRPVVPAITSLQNVFSQPFGQTENRANRAMQLIAGRLYFRAAATATQRSGTGPAGRRAGRVPSLPTPTINPPRQPSIPDRGR